MSPLRMQTGSREATERSRIQRFTKRFTQTNEVLCYFHVRFQLIIELYQYQSLSITLTVKKNATDITPLLRDYVQGSESLWHQVVPDTGFFEYHY